MENRKSDDARVKSTSNRFLSCCLAAATLMTTLTALATAGNVPPVLTHVAPFLNSNGEAAVLTQNNNYSFEDLRKRSDLFDANDDALSLRIVSVNSGTLKLNGQFVTPGVSIVTAGDILTWLPDHAGTSIQGFTVDAFDGTDYSAAPVAVSFDVTWSLNHPNSVPSIFEGESLASTKENPLTISYQALKNATLASDGDGDPIFFVITKVTAGQLTKDGTPVAAGSTTVGPHESLVWAAPAGSLDTTVDAFSVKASDFQDYSANEVAVTISVGGNHAPVLTGVDPFLRENFEAAHLSEASHYTFNQLYRRSDVVDIDDDPITFRIVSVNSGSLLINGTPAIANVSTITPEDTFDWTPSAGGSKVTAFVVDAFDGKEYSTNTVAVQFDVYDPAPSFTGGSDISFLRGNETRCFGTIANWARNIQPYDSALSFVVSNDNPDMFISAPEITADGTLLYGVDPEAYGIANVSVVLRDDQGRESAPVSFKFNIGFVNWAPNVQNMVTVSVQEDAGLTTIPSFITSVDAGSSWENGQSITYTVVTTNAALYSVKPTVDSTGTLTFKPTANSSGTDNLKLIVKDSGGTANGGSDTATSRFTIKVVPVNDPPVIKNAAFYMVENSTLQTNLTIVDADDNVANAQISVVSFDPAFFATVQVNKTSATNTLVINPIPGRYGRTQVTLSASDGKDSANFIIPVLVTNINHPPHFSVNNSRITGNYVAAKITVPNAVSLIDKGGPNEDYQTVTYVVTTSAPLLFKVKPTISVAGTLTYQLIDAIADGTEVPVSIVAKDNGKTNNISDVQQLTIVAPVNPFVSAKGSYNGLFYNNDAVQNNSAGSYTTTVTDKGAYSGKVMVEGGAYSFSGRYSTDGNSQATIVRAGKTPLSLTINLANSQVTGSITDYSWTAQIAADKAIYSITNPTPRAGKYTVMIPRGTDGPVGHSFATVNITPDGHVTTVANLADGTTVSQSSTLSAREQYPLFSSLYRGAGCLLSWATLTNTDAANVSGAVTWIKTGTTNFSSESDLDGSTFTPGSIGKRVLNVTNLTVVVDTADAGSLQIPAVLTTNNTLIVQNPTLAKLSLNATSGLVSGTVRNQTTGTDVPVKAIVLQKQNKLGGYCLGPNAAGAVYNE